jgi:hypothetical protein
LAAKTFVKDDLILVITRSGILLFISKEKRYHLEK